MELFMRSVLASMRAISTPKRLRLLALLTRGSFCRCHLAEALQVEPDTIMPDLGVLVRSGLVVAETHGLFGYYSLATPAMHPRHQLLLQWLMLMLRDDRTISEDIGRLEKILQNPAVRRCDTHRAVWKDDASLYLFEVLMSQRSVTIT
jgi:ArsR family transcriptional regulator